MSEKDKNQPNYHREEHDQMERSWKIIDAVAGGTLYLRDAGTRWLPMEPAEDQRDYAIRLRRAIFFNAFERTLHGLVGLVFRKDPTLAANNSPAIFPIWENVDNQGTHGAVFAKEVFNSACKYGHSLILVDMPPPLPQGATLADERAANRRPYWVSYEADQIVNWRTTIVDGKQVLTMLVLEEESLEPDGLYGHAEVERYRVLRPGSWEVYREVEDVEGRTSYILEDSGTTSLPYIPAAIVYARKTGFLTSKPPLLDLALLNLSHYQKYSDLSTYLHIASRPLLWFRGRNINQQVEAIGPYTFFDVEGTNGTVAFAETSGSALGAAKDDLIHLEHQMAVLGLSLLNGSKVVPTTATETLLSHVKEESDLATAARSLRDALDLCLQFTADFMGVESGNVELGSTTADLMLSPEEMRVWVESAGKVFSFDTIYKIFGKAGKLPQDFDPETEKDLLDADTANLGAEILTAFDRGR